MSDLLSRLRSTPDMANPEAAEPAAEGKRAYAALRPEPQNRRTPARLRIVYGDGVVSLMSYTFLSEVLCTSPQFISLIYAHCVITLEGQHLLGLVDLLQEDKARTITCFNARWHDAPEPGAPIITRIARQAIAGKQGDGGTSRQRSTSRTDEDISR